MTTSIGYATLQIIPSLDGVSKSINRQIGGPFAAAGLKAGREFTSKAAAEIARDRKIEQATETKAKAVDGLTKAMDRAADAAGRVRAAEANLESVRASGNEARQVAAEEKLAAARRKVAAETRNVTSATNEVARATQKVDDAMKNGGGGDSGGGSGAGLVGLALVGRGGLSGLSALSSKAGSMAGMAARAGIVGAIGAGGAAAILSPLIAGFKAFQWGAEVGLPLERSLNTLQGVTNASGAQMAAAGNIARSLGSDISLAGVTAGDAAKAMTELAKGGLDVDQAMTAAKGTLQLATAGQMDAAEAAQYQTAAMNMFSLGADKAGHVADLLAQSANASSAEVHDIALALQQGGSVAAGFGLSIEETLTALTAFSKMGINSSDAGTMLKTSLLAITDQGKPAQAAIDDLGLSLYDAQGRFVGYTNMMKQVAAASNRMTQEQFQAATATLFGSDAMRAAMIAGNKGPQLFSEVATAMNNVDGAAARMAGAQMHGLPGVLEGLDNTLDGVKLTVYDAGNAIMTALGQEALGAVDGLADTVRMHLPEMIGFFTGLGTQAVAGISATVRALGELVGGVADFAGILGHTWGTFLKIDSFVQRIGGNTAAADEESRRADEAFNWGKGLSDLSTKMGAAADRIDGFRGKLQAAGDQANSAAKLSVQLGQAVASLPDGKTITIDSNDPELIKRLEALGFKVEHLPDGKIAIIAQTDEATRIADAWRQQQGAKPADVPVKVDTSQADADMRGFLDRYRQILTGTAPTPAMPQIPMLGTTGPGLPTPPGRALGGLFSGLTPLANGGLLPAAATIQAPVGPAGLVQWAEPSTKGEAFIPLGGGERSKKIWRETGKRLGVAKFDLGGFTSPDVMAARSMDGTGYSQGSRTDCSGMVARVINRAMGLPDSGLMSTKNAAQWLAARGFQSGVGPPGSITVGWYDHGPNPNDGHMAMTLSDGTAAEAGGAHGTFLVGGGAKSATDPQFDQHMFLPNVYGQGPAGSGGFARVAGMGFGGGPAGGTPGVNEYGEQGFYTPDAKQVREAEERVADADSRVQIAEARQRELKADAKESQKKSAEAEVEKARREAADARADLAEAQRGKFTAAKSDTGGSGASGGTPLGFKLPTAFSGLASMAFDGMGFTTQASPNSPARTFEFGDALGSAVGGQVSSVLDVFGAGDSPSWLNAASTFLSGISIGGGGGSSANPLSAAPAATGAMLPDAGGGDVHGARAGQRPGPVFNISTARVEDAFLQAKRISDQNAATKVDRWL